jgi:hypothetical protein
MSLPPFQHLQNQFLQPLDDFAGLRMFFGPHDPAEQVFRRQVVQQLPPIRLAALCR